MRKLRTTSMPEFAGPYVGLVYRRCVLVGYVHAPSPHSKYLPQNFSPQSPLFFHVYIVALVESILVFLRNMLMKYTNIISSQIKSIWFYDVTTEKDL